MKNSENLKTEIVKKNCELNFNETIKIRGGGNDSEDEERRPIP